jgi:uncharacterized protein (TIGR02266 family)
MAERPNDLIAEERAATERDAELTARERAIHGKERGLEERRRSLAEREASLRGRAADLAVKALDLKLTVHEEVRSAATSRVLEQPLAELAASDRRALLSERAALQDKREDALDAAELAAARVEETLRDAEAELGHRENSAAALAREVIRRERAELDRRETLAREMAQRQRQEAQARSDARAQSAAQPPPAPGRSSASAARPGGPTTAETAATLLHLPRPLPADDGANRRVFPRLNVELEVSLSSEHNFYAGFTQNVSEGGLFIASLEYPPVGAEVDVKLRLSTGREIRGRARVAWIREYNEDTPDVSPGMGVQFVGLSPADVAIINAFVRQREPMFFEA